MARILHKLNDAKVRSLSTVAGFHSDGGGLYLQVNPPGASWILRFTLARRTRDMGLGSIADVSLLRARERAAEKRALVAQGIDPIERAKSIHTSAAIKVAGSSGPTFEECAEAYMDDRLKRCRNEVHRGQWRTSLRMYAYPLVGRMPVADISTQDILNVLRNDNFWETRCETAKRVLNRIERVLARATVEGHRTGSNPATWRGHLQEALPSRSEMQPVIHHAAMDYRDVPAFLSELMKRTGVSAAALRFLILTASRTGEVRGAKWPEINWHEKTWTVPRERAKTGKEHIVPLSTGAMAILRTMESLRDLGGGYIFPGSFGRGLSKGMLIQLMQRKMKYEATTHGFRSSFRDWCGDEADVPRDLAEASLAHVAGGTTERAYRRRTAVEKRRAVMQAWCDYIMPPTAEVVDMIGARQEAATAA